MESSEAIQWDMFIGTVTPKVMQRGDLGLSNQPQPMSEVSGRQQA